MLRPCLLDTSIVLSFTGVGRFDVIGQDGRYEWFVTPIVRSELIRPADRGPVDDAIANGRVHLAAIDNANELELREWASWSAVVDPGEAEAIAVAVSRGWIVAIEDLRAQRALDRAVGRGRWLNSANVLLGAIRDGRLPIDQADSIFRSLDCYLGYQKRGISTLSQLASWLKLR